MYIYTLDSHDCIGPFKDRDAVEQWIANRKDWRHTYQVLRDPPYQTTIPIKPW